MRKSWGDKTSFSSIISPATELKSSTCFKWKLFLSYFLSGSQKVLKIVQFLWHMIFRLKFRSLEIAFVWDILKLSIGFCYLKISLTVPKSPLCTCMEKNQCSMISFKQFNVNDFIFQVPKSLLLTLYSWKLSLTVILNASGHAWPSLYLIFATTLTLDCPKNTKSLKSHATPSHYKTFSETVTKYRSRYTKLK